MSSLVDQLVSGTALLSDFDDWVEEWHSNQDPASDGLELHEFLGLSWDEYRLCVEEPHALRFIVAARKIDRPLAEVLAETSGFALAARNEDQDEASKLYAWLVKTGRVSGKDR